VDFLQLIEQSGLGTWVRESPSVMAYPTFLFLHTLGLGLLVGTSAAMSLRVLGFGRQMSLAPLEKFMPVLWLGFLITAVSGVVIWTADASTFTFNPLFWIKLGAIALAMASVRLLRASVFGKSAVDPPTATARVLAVGLLALWTIAMTSGRLTAYIGR
jgi:hypothetical protein